MIVKMLVEGGAMKVNPGIAQKLGPLGVNMGKITQEVNKSTKDFPGMKVPVSLDIDVKTKNFTVEVGTPPTAELLKKEIGVEKGSGQQLKSHIGNIAIETVIKIAKIKQKDMLVNNLKSAVKNVIGSCVSSGILVESKSAKEAAKMLGEGIFDEAISKELTEVSQEKLDKLKEEFESLKKKEEALLKAEEEAKAAKEAEKAAKAAAAGVAAPAAPEAKAAAKPEAAKAEAAAAPETASKAAAKPEEKKEKK